MMNYGAVRGLVNYDDLVKDTELYNIIKDIDVSARFNLEVYSFVKQEIDDLIVQINSGL